MWDDHWSRGAAERVEALAPRMNRVVKSARSKGVRIIHAPSEVMAFYAETPARQRVLAAPYSAPPLGLAISGPALPLDPPLPIDDSDNGSDTGETEFYPAWSRQHPAIEIEQELDGISDDGQEIFNFIKQQEIKQLLLMGVHTNFCVLKRSFGIRQMVKWGQDIVLVRDLTDALYNPAMPPYVSHDEGTRLVINYIEQFWCPSILSRDLL